MLNFKNDGFKKSRGGYSRWLLISCEKCKTPLFFYQKDGTGILKRLYLDRIVERKPSFKNKRSFVCKKCKIVLGTHIIYKKEKRSAYRLFAGAIEKKMVSEDSVARFLQRSKKT